MAFNPSPNSWLNNYNHDGGQGIISFTLPVNRTAEMEDALSCIYRIVELLASVYNNKAAADRPVRWLVSETRSQPSTAEAVTNRTIINTFVLDASLLDNLSLPALSGVALETPSVEFTGEPYAAYIVTAPSGSSESLMFSADGGATYTETPPTNRGNYLARLIATKDGRTAEVVSSFVIQKTPVLIGFNAPFDQIVTTPTYTINFLSNRAPTSVISQNNVVSVISFSGSYSGGGYVGQINLQVNTTGEMRVVVRVAEDANYYSGENTYSADITKHESVITLSDIEINDANPRDITFETNFELTPARYILMTFSGSGFIITKNASYPPTLTPLAPGEFTLTAAFAGDSVYENTIAQASVTIGGTPVYQNVTVGPAGVIVTPPNNQAEGEPWATGKNATIRIGLDADQDGELDGEILLPYSFTITISNDDGYFGTSGSLSTSFSNLVTNDWIDFAVSGDVVTATITSIPSSINSGELTGGALFVTRAPTAFALGWRAQLDINFFRAGKSFKLEERGMRNSITSPPQIVAGASLTLNANALYNDSWNNDQPHQAIIFIAPTGGAPSSGITATWERENYYTPSPITFDNDQTTKSIIEGIGYNILIKKGGTSTLSITATSGGTTTTRTITFDVRKIAPTLNAVQLSPPPCCSSTNSGLDSVEIINSGSGYDFAAAAPTVTVGPPNAIGGTQAVVTATVSGGSITAIAVGSSGSGYTSAPTVTITPAAGDAGTGATAIASILYGSITFRVTVQYDSGVYANRFYIDGVAAPALNLLRGYAYTFDQSASSNSSHPIAFKNTDGSTYTTGVVTTGTAGTSGAKTVFTVAGDAPDGLRYYCMSHGNVMGESIAISGSYSPGVKSFIVQTPGTDYKATPTITLSGGGGTGASAGAVTRTLGRISNLNIINAGSGYYTPPLITIAPPPAPAI